MAASVFSPLRIRPFALLLYGQVVSNAGDWLDFLALNALVAYRWGLGAGALAALVVARMLPLAVCGPLAGVWADRLPRRALMVACDLARAALVLGLVAAPNLLLVLVLVAAKAAVSTLFDPAQQGALRALVPEDSLLGAKTLSLLSQQATKVVAPVLGGVLVVAAGPRAAFVADAASFLVSAAFIFRLPNFEAGGGPVERAADAPTRFWAEFREGLRYSFSRPLLALVISCMAFGFLVVFIYDTFLALLTKTAGIGESGYGLVVSMVALGGVLGSLAAGQWAGPRSPLRLLVACTIASGALVAAAGLGGLGYFHSYSALAEAGLWFLIGLAGGAVQVYAGYLVQRETPKELMGRVWAIASTAQNVFPFLGPIIGAALVGWIGVGGVFLVAGGGYVLLGLVAGTVVRLKRLDIPRPESSRATEGQTAVGQRPT